MTLSKLKQEVLGVDTLLEAMNTFYFKFKDEKEVYKLFLIYNEKATYIIKIIKQY